MFDFDYKKALYRRNNFGQPCVWYAKESFDSDYVYSVYHGIVSKTITNDVIITHRLNKDEIETKIKNKRKIGYKFLSEIKDDSNCFPVEEELYDYLFAYLPNIRTSSNNEVLPMLAKTFDNFNNKVFNKVSIYKGQWKINGLRCNISAVTSNHDIFRPIRLRFQSREGIYWNSLQNLEDYLLDIIPKEFLMKMVEEHYILDGEIYLPGYSINQIDHFVKDAKCYENSLLQFWNYDLAIEDIVQYHRFDILREYFKPIRFFDKAYHLNNTVRFIHLPTFDICNEEDAIKFRDRNIELGFEGAILRNPTEEYQFGKRNSSMIKFKKSTDGIFKILDIIPEGVKRANLPLFICKNDINDNTFKCHIGGSQSYQEQCLNNKNNIIGKFMYVEFGERSGVEQVPFHIKLTKLNDIQV